METNNYNEQQLSEMNQSEIISLVLALQKKNEEVKGDFDRMNSLYSYERSEVLRLSNEIDSLKLTISTISNIIKLSNSNNGN